MLSYPREVIDALIVAQDTYVWEAPEHDFYQRGPSWYLYMSLAALFLMAYAVWTTNFLFAFLILLIAIILVLAGNEAPKATLVQIGDNGIVWRGGLYLFQDLDAFSIIYAPPMSKVLYIEPRSSLRSRLRIPLEDQNPVEIREHLKQYLREDLDLRNEHLSDIVGRLLKI